MMVGLTRGDLGRGAIAINQFVIERFHLALRAGLINRFGEIPTANKLAIEFNFRNIQSDPISRESARKWINGQSLPNSARLKTLISWLNLDASFIYLTSGLEDAHPHLQGKSLKEIATQDAYAIRQKESLAQAAINFSSPLTAILDKDGVIIFVNSAWRAAAMIYPKLKDGNLGCEGINYLEVCERAKGPDSAEAQIVAKSIREVIDDNRKSFKIKYPCHSIDDRRWFEVKISAFQYKKDVCFISTHTPITEDIFNLKEE